MLANQNIVDQIKARILEKGGANIMRWYAPDITIALLNNLLSVFRQGTRFKADDLVWIFSEEVGTKVRNLLDVTCLSTYSTHPIIYSTEFDDHIIIASHDGNYVLLDYVATSYRTE